MNIHEHQAKEILKKYGAIVPAGVFSTNVDDLIEKAKNLKTERYVLKAQIHAGGRGKAGGVKILNTLEELKISANEMLGKTLVTHQTGPEGREVKRLYVEESSNIEKELGIEAQKEFMAMQKGDVQSTLSDTFELQKLIGFKPQTTLKKGIKKFINWYKEFYII